MAYLNQITKTTICIGNKEAIYNQLSVRCSHSLSFWSNKSNVCVAKHCAYFLSESLWNECCRFRVGLVWNVEEICGRWGLSGTWWPLPPCHMCKRFIKPRSGVRRLGFCFLFHTDRGFIWVQISAPPSKAWQWQPFKHGPVLKPLQTRHRASLRVSLWLWQDVYVSTLPPRIILWQHSIELLWLMFTRHSRFGWWFLSPTQSISANVAFDLWRLCYTFML